MLSQSKTGFIVESLSDGKRFPVFAHERVSSLEEISIFTTDEEDLPLKEVFRRFFDKLEGKSAPDPKSQEAEMKKFFEETIADYDAEKVHISDMKKALTWYNLLLEKDMLEFTEEQKTEEQAKPDETGHKEEPKEQPEE